MRNGESVIDTLQIVHTSCKLDNGLCSYMDSRQFDCDNRHLDYYYYFFLERGRPKKNSESEGGGSANDSSTRYDQMDLMQGLTHDVIVVILQARSYTKTTFAH